VSLVPRIFPYNYPRLAQIEIWSALSKLNESRVIFIEAPTGVGKTVALLSYLLERYNRILWFCYTHRQQEVVLKEAKRIEEKTGASLSTVLIRGISSLCPIREVKKSVYPHQACRYYSAVYGCVECPYREQFLRALSSRLTVATYAYLREPYFQKIASLIDLADVLVFDEAHHLLQPPRVEVPLKWIEEAYREYGCELFKRMVRREKVVDIDESELLLLSSVGEEILAERGQSYCLEVARVLRGVKRVFYDKREDKYTGLRRDFHEFLKEFLENKKAIFVSATLPEQVKLILSSGEVSRVRRHEYNFKCLIYSGVKLPKRAWKKFKVLRGIQWVVSVISRFYKRALIVFPSTELLEMFKERYKLPSNTIPIVAGSREAEGVDVDANACIILGVPYDRVTRITIETVKYFRKYTRKPKTLGYIIPAVIKAVQAAGRILRKPNRVIVFYDKRWIKLTKYFPVWLRNSGIKVVSRRSQLYNELVYYSCFS